MRWSCGTIWAVLAGVAMGCGGEERGERRTGAAATSSASGGGGAAGASVSAGSGGGGAGGTLPTDACSTPIEGYGAVTMGGDGGDVYPVVSLDDDGPGTLRHGVESRNGPRRIVFDVAGTIVLANALRIDEPFLTIDGCSAPPSGITLTSSNPSAALVSVQATHDIVLRGLRLVGLWQPGGSTNEGTACLIIDGDSNPDHVAARMVIDHLTITGGNDAALDVWGEVQDLTVSWSLLHDNARGGLVSHYPAPYQVRQRITYHHNVYSRNTERNPQIRADVRDFHYLNNVVHDWGFHDPPSGYGIRIRNDGAEPPVHASFVNNAFVSAIQPDRAFIDAGTGSQIYLDGNIFPPAFSGDPSTLSAPPPVPPAAEVSTHPAAGLRDVVLPLVGVRDRTPAEQSLLDAIAGAL